MDHANAKSAPKKRLNPVLMEAITSKYLFRKKDDQVNVAMRTLSKEQVEKKFHLLFAHSQWKRAFGSVTKSLWHIDINRRGLFVSNMAYVYHDDCKKLVVDDDILRYLREEFDLNFKTLEVTGGFVKTVTGKQFCSTTAIVDAGIDGGCETSLTELTFRLNALEVDAGAVIRRNVATLRTLRCFEDAATYAGLLPPELKLEKFEAYVTGGNTLWTLGDVVTVLETNAVSIDLKIMSACTSFEMTHFGYPVAKTFSCQRLAVKWIGLEDCGGEHLASLMECIGASVRDLESLEMTLAGSPVDWV